jgi:hypothetical protein
VTTVVITHPVGNMETWLAGGDGRKAVFAQFCSSYRIFKHADGNRISIVCENVDIAKMKATLSAPETEAAKKKHTVMDPIDVYIEVDGGK